MKSTLIFTLLMAFYASTTLARPFSLTDIFPGFIANSKLVGPAQPEQHNKRHAVLDNPDAELKQISLQSLISNVEDSLFETALSVNRATEEGSVVEEVVPPNDEVNHGIVKREHSAKTTGEHEVSTGATTDDTTDEAERAKNVLLQTTKKVVEEGKPAHILIDHISVQPHHGGVPLVPTFQVHHTKLTSVKDDKNSENADGQTKISITKTSITSHGVENADNAANANKKPNGDLTIGVPGKFTLSIPGIASNANVAAAPEANKDASSTTPAAEKSITSSTTTKEPIKEAEEKLKEKVAEIEAEPVILSARV